MKEILGKITQLTAHNGDVKSNLERVFGEKFIPTRAERLQGQSGSKDAGRVWRGIPAERAYR